MDTITIIFVVIMIAVFAVFIFAICKEDKFDAISFKESLDLSELPVVTFTNNGRKINFLLDSGANKSILNINELDTCDYKLLAERNALSGLDGVNRAVNNVLIKISYKESTFEEEFQVTDMSTLFSDIKQETGVTIHGLLGTAFFQKYKYVLDFNELIAYSKMKNK